MWICWFARTSACFKPHLDLNPYTSVGEVSSNLEIVISTKMMFHFERGADMKLTGGCYCKGIRYTYDGEIKAALQCHCRECQYITGGHPNAIVILDLDGFKYDQGTPASFKRSDLEKPVTRFFCPACGTAIGTQTPTRPGSMVVKVGTLDDPSVYQPKIAIFTVDKQAFHHIPDDVQAFERRPG